MLYNSPEFKWITLFFIYSILGWIFESCYVSLKMGAWTNRGFMKGPYLPIYGTGAVMMLVISEPFKNNLILTYIAGFIGATLLELVVGIAIEHIFKVRYWDYSYKKINYKGYICLSSSIAWGFFTIGLNRWLHPAVTRVLKLIPETTGEILFAGIAIIFSVDLVLSVREAMDMRNILIRMEAIRHEMQEIKKRADKRAEVYLAVLDDSLNEMKAGIGARHVELGRAIENQQAEFAKALGEQKEEFTRTVGEQQAEFTRAIGESQEEFTRAIGESQEEFTKAIGETQEGLGQAFEEQQTEFTRTLEKLDEARKSLESELLSFKDRILGNPTMTSKKYGLSLDILKSSIFSNQGNKDKEDVDETVS
jgi:uncharacterized membrane protein